MPCGGLRNGSPSRRSIAGLHGVKLLRPSGGLTSGSHLDRRHHLLQASNHPEGSPNPASPGRPDVSDRRRSDTPGNSQRHPGNILVDHPPPRALIGSGCSTSRLVRRLLSATALEAPSRSSSRWSADLPPPSVPWPASHATLAPVVVTTILANYAAPLRRMTLLPPPPGDPTSSASERRSSSSPASPSIRPGEVGELLKAVLVRDLIGESLSRVASVVMAERLTDMAGLLLLSALGATALPHGGVLLAAVTRLLVLAVASSAPVAHRLSLHAEAPARRALTRLAEPLPGLPRRGPALVAPAPLASAILLSVVSSFCECLGFYLVLQGLKHRRLARCRHRAVRVRLPGRHVHACPAGSAGGGRASPVSSSPWDGPPDAAAATLLIRTATLWFAVTLARPWRSPSTGAPPSPSRPPPDPRLGVS